jgi:hypothetical protein
MIKFANKGKIGQVSYVMIISSESKWVTGWFWVQCSNSSIPSFRKLLVHVLPPLLIDKQVCLTSFVNGVEIMRHIVCFTLNYLLVPGHHVEASYQQLNHLIWKSCAETWPTIWDFPVRYLVVFCILVTWVFCKQLQTYSFW